MKKEPKKPQLNLFSTGPLDPLVREIESLDEQMEAAIQNGEFEMAKELAKKQEELLDDLMNRSA